MTTHSRSRGAERREPRRGAGRGKLSAVIFYCSRELRVAPSRELLAVETTPHVVVLTPARTVNDMTGSSRFRSNSKGAAEGSHYVRTVKSSRYRSNGNKIIAPLEQFGLLF